MGSLLLLHFNGVAGAPHCAGFFFVRGGGGSGLGFRKRLGLGSLLAHLHGRADDVHGAGFGGSCGGLQGFRECLRFLRCEQLGIELGLATALACTHVQGFAVGWLALFQGDRGTAWRLGARAAVRRGACTWVRAGASTPTCVRHGVEGAAWFLPSFGAAAGAVACAPHPPPRPRPHPGPAFAHAHTLPCRAVLLEVPTRGSITCFLIRCKWHLPFHQDTVHVMPKPVAALWAFMSLVQHSPAQTPARMLPHPHTSCTHAPTPTPAVLHARSHRHEDLALVPAPACLPHHKVH